MDIKFSVNIADDKRAGITQHYQDWLSVYAVTIDAVIELDPRGEIITIKVTKSDDEEVQSDIIRWLKTCAVEFETDIRFTIQIIPEVCDSVGATWTEYQKEMEALR